MKEFTANQWRNRRGCREAEFTGLAKQSYQAGEDIEEGGERREEGKRRKRGSKREKGKEQREEGKEGEMTTVRLGAHYTVTTVRLGVYFIDNIAPGSPPPLHFLTVTVKYFGSTFWVKSPGKILPPPGDRPLLRACRQHLQCVALFAIC